MRWAKHRITFNLIYVIFFDKICTLNFIYISWKWKIGKYFAQKTTINIKTDRNSCQGYQKNKESKVVEWFIDYSWIAINVKFWVKTWYEFHLSACRKSFDLWWWQIPCFKAYFKCNLKGLIDLFSIIDCFKATEQNIFCHIFKAISVLLFYIFVIPNWLSYCGQES